MKSNTLAFCGAGRDWDELWTMHEQAEDPQVKATTAAAMVQCELNVSCFYGRMLLWPLEPQGSGQVQEGAECVALWALVGVRELGPGCGEELEQLQVRMRQQLGP